MTYFPNNPQDFVQIAGLWLTRTSLKILVASRNNAGNAGTFRLITDTAGTGYTPSGATAFHARAFVTVGAGGHEISLGYADADLGFRSAGAPSNPVYLGGGSTANVNAYAAASLKQEFVIDGWICPNAKYPFVTSALNGASFAYLFGYEV